MYGGPRSPSWHRDVIWAAGVVALVATSVAAFAFSWSRLADEELGPSIIAEVLRVTLVPVEGASAMLDVRDEVLSVDGPLEVLAGSGVRVDPTEVPGFDVDAAVDRVAGVWSRRLLDGGAEAVLAGVSDPVLSAQLAQGLEGPASDLMRAELAEEMLQAGLADGSRLANWQLQAQQNPGEEVQPVVGVFVFIDPEELGGLSDRQIGERVIDALASLVMTDGADAAREAVTNLNLTARLEQGLSQGRAAVHALFETILVSRRSELEGRLEEVRTLLDAADQAPQGLSGVLPAGELAGVEPDEANDAILEALAERTWSDGPELLADLLEGDPRASRIAAARPAVTAFTQAARGRATRLAWGAGVIGLLAVAVMVALSRDAGRAFRPGAAVLLGAAPGTWLTWVAQRGALDSLDAGVPATVPGGGAFAALGSLMRYLATHVPEAAVAAALRVHVSAAAVGGVLVLVALIMVAMRGLRPRRRSYI